MAGELQVEVVPWGADARAMDAVASAVLEHPAAREELGDSHTRLLGVRPLEGDEVEAAPRRVRATVYDYDRERTLLLDAALEGGERPVVSSTARQPLATPDERDAALRVLEQDPELGERLRSGAVTPFAPMPPLVLDELPDGRVQRTVTVGLRPAGDEPDEIVGVQLGTGRVRRFDGGSPATARAAARRCGLPNAGQRTVTNASGAARVTVSRDGEVLWRFVAVRPAASAGTNGSGIELRGVAYRGRRVLRRAHVPILNVRYDGDACGPFRDWQNEEGRFQADGEDVAPGFRLCPRPAATILDNGRDRGNFAGVAVFVDGEEVVLVSELEAGWYRYISAWRLHADGTIRPRFGFGAVKSACVCTTHHHHTYWRLDFDIAGAADDVVHEFNDPPLPGHDAAWHVLRHEIRRRRDRGRGRRWRVRNRASGQGYLIKPGAGDGRADAFGVGDFWALRHRGGQLDDGQGFTTDPGAARAHLDRFVNGEPIVGTNVVVWYAAHFSHDLQGEHGDEHGHVVGPTLSPERW